LSGTREQMIRF